MTSVANLPVYMLPGAPVVQQPRSGLDAGDSSLATEILPAPPSVASVLQAATKRDPRKPTPLVSYLPQHDPGTTYAGMLTGPVVGSLEGNPEIDGPRRKRARVDKGLASHRAQRASTRALNSAVPIDDMEMTDTIAMDITDSYPGATGPDSDGPLLSRSNSVSIFEEPAVALREPMAQKRDKGKGRAKDRERTSIVRVKEEPPAVTLQTNETISSVRNEDHCSACRSLGSLVYCDGCTRAYHLWCLDPPMETTDLPEGDNRWFCPSCSLRHNPPPKPPASFMSSLILHVQTTPPVEFQLPEDIRTFFKSVGTNARGAYVDTSVVKPPRLNRHGQLEERDPFRTKDRNGAPVLCFHCGTSALPEGMTATPPPTKRLRRSSAQQPPGPEQGKRIVSCDYCPLHWHLDCIDPPLLAMPPFDRKWMCPNHADNVLRTKRRIPRQNPTVIDVTRAGQSNNGNIEITEPEASSTYNKVVVDEVYISGRRYRVPERVIKLDFWSKVTADRHHTDHVSGLTSGMSSPLTSLSSLDGNEMDSEISPPTKSIPHSLDADDLRLALYLLDLSRNNTGTTLPAPTLNGNGNQDPRKILVDGGIQTETSTASPSRAKRPRQPTAKVLEAARKADLVPKVEEPSDKDLGPGPERRQPARASKRDVKYVISLLDATDSADEGYGHSAAAGAPSKRKPGRPRQSTRRRASSPKPPRTTKDAVSIASAAAPVHPHPAVEPSPSTKPVTPSIASAVPQSTAHGSPNKTEATPSVPAPSSTSLKIRLPRLNGLNLTSTSAPKPQTSPTAITLKPSRPRRSLRRQGSTPGSSSTSVSKIDGEIKTERESL